MTSRPFFDTNVLVYAFGDPRLNADDPRPDRALALLLEGGSLSVQVLTEYADVAQKKLGFSWSHVAQALNRIQSLCGDPVPLMLTTHHAALAIAERNNLRIYDAMILASALEARCTILYTEDLQHGQTIEGLRIENPFLAA
jgi:predicted nucleic acid-binding protein